VAAPVADVDSSDDPGLEDPIAFVVAAVLTIACAIIVFVIVVPRTTGNIRSVEGTDRCASQPIVTAGVFALT
jgi:hypothetical protein